ncbi:hypothetical protein AAON49_10710 [Pseudotenacibaculum sp. MALMAid0570]|uniref:hypothetical protein n=1 Tax=Pseudotenacibaculum sp. MALMAid0570 TaxID=3143938 RepID=UPI0032DFB821
MLLQRFQIETFSRLCFVTLGTIYFLSQLLFFFGFSLNTFTSVGIVIVAIILSNLFIKNKKLIYPTLFIVLTFILFVIINLYIDFTWDGQAYHQEMAIRMAEGWNPITTKQDAIWVYHYPKAFETLGAFFYMIFGTIKAVKIPNLFIFLLLFLYSFSYIKKYYSKVESLGISVIIAFNPILLCQLTSNLVDGFLYAICIILVLSYLNLKKNKRYLIDFFLALIILVNIKYTGVVFACAIIGYVGFYELFIKKNRAIVKKIVIASIAMIPFLYTPYIKNNLIENNHVFYPLMGENKIDFAENYVPEIIKPYNRFERIILANFTTISNRGEGEFKIPFTFSMKELQRYRNGGPRNGILGVWWSGLLLISLLYYFFNLIKLRKEFAFSHFEMIILCILFFTFINKAGWWYRYTPFIWLIPLFLTLSIKRYKKSRLFEYNFLFIAIVNGLLTLSISFGAKYIDTKRFEDNLQKLASKSYRIDFGDFYGNKILLKEYDIKYIESDKSTFKNPISLNSEVILEIQDE